MVEQWSVVTGGEALSYAGTPAHTLPAAGVTYVVGPSATLVIVDAGDRPDGNAVQNFDELTVREPFPDTVATRLRSADPPMLGFVRVPEGYLPLGKLYNAVSRVRSIDDGGRPWPFGGRSALMWCNLRFPNRLGYDVLDRVRPTLEEPLPSVDWLSLLPNDPITALVDYVAGWYADIPLGRDALMDSELALPEPLVAFYQAAASRREVLGEQNMLCTVDQLQLEDDGRILFGWENQGVFEVLIDPAESDPIVQYEGIDAGDDREPLSSFLLQFLLVEASFASPFSCFATVTAEQASRLVGPLHRVPLQPMHWPVNPTRHHVAPGLVVTTCTHADGSVEVYGGSRHRCALRSLRDPGFTWEHFDG